MPLPRQPRAKSRHPDGPRSRRRRLHQKRWLAEKIMQRFAAMAEQLARRNQNTYRGAHGVIVYLNEGDPIPSGLQKVEFDENGKMIADTAQEKAPGLAAEGFSSFFDEKETLSG